MEQWNFNDLGHTHLSVSGFIGNTISYELTTIKHIFIINFGDVGQIYESTDMSNARLCK